MDKQNVYLFDTGTFLLILNNLNNKDEVPKYFLRPCDFNK